MRTLFAAALIAIGLGILLIWRPALANKGMYRLGFLVGIATFGALVLSTSTSWTLYVNRNSGFIIVILSLLSATVPFVLLVEAGLSGYRGFSSSVRYICLSIAVLGAGALVASLLAPGSPRN